jgi:hypothetical protein
MGTAAPPKYLDRPPAGWFMLDVMRSDSRKWDWVVLLIDVPFEELKNCTTESTSEI